MRNNARQTAFAATGATAMPPLSLTARLAGLLFLLIIAAGLFGEAVVRGSIFSENEPAVIVQSIRDNEFLFRIGIVIDLAAFILVIFLTYCLYLLTKPYGGSLAILAVFFRLGEAVISAIITLNGFIILIVLSDAAMQSNFSEDQVNALALVFKQIHSVGYDLGIVFFTLGASIFSFIFFKSQIIPRAISALYFIAALQLLASTLAMMIVPRMNGLLYPVYLLPLLVAELLIGVWLLLFAVNDKKSGAIMRQGDTDEPV